MGNIFGRRFRNATWGESHGPALGAVVDGCPAGLPLSVELIAAELARDVPIEAIGTTRREPNAVEILSGIFEGRTLGTPISLVIRNGHVRSESYRARQHTPRPGHGDLTYRQRWGHVDWRGGSRASGRECIARLAAGAVARALLAGCGITVTSSLVELAGLPAATSPERSSAVAPAREIKAGGGASGGMAQVEIAGLPAGLGAPVFHKLEAELSAAILGIGGVRSFAIGQGYEAHRATGPAFNDPIVMTDGAPTSPSNRAGGVAAGISTGEPLWFRFGVKPTPSVTQAQQTVDLRSGEPVEVSVDGHFDANFTPRVAVVAEAMACLVLVDHLLEGGGLHPTRYERSELVQARDQG